MLNLTDIAQRIAQPHLCSSSDAEDLRLLCEKYPYSQVFPLLYLSVLARSNDVHFDQELTKQAYKISDRTRLYELISEKDERREATDNTRETIHVRLETENYGLNEEDKQEEVIEEIQPTNETDSLISNMPELDPSFLHPTPNIEPITAKEDSFQDEITAQTIATSYSLEQEELRWNLEEKKDERHAKEDVRLETIDKKGQETLEDIPLINESYRPASNLQLPTSEVDSLVDKIVPSSFEKSIEIESKKSFSSWLHANENYAETKEEKVEINDLIAKFIDESPKISQPNEKLFEGRKEKKEFFSPTKKAKESLSEHQLPVSETLAKIFAAQGNFPKAIYAYEQLMLIIPEKKIFFANQIKELQKKLNQ